MRRALAVLCVLSGVAAGCDDDGADDGRPVVDGAVDAGPVPGMPDGGRSVDAEPFPDASPAAEGWVDLGTGARRYEPLDCGDAVPIIAGIQGGYHVWGGFRGGGFEDDEVRIRFELSLDGVVYARADYTEFGLPRGRDGAFDYAAVAVVYEDNDEVRVTSGRVMTLRIALEAADGQVLTDAVEVVPTCCE